MRYIQRQFKINYSKSVTCAIHLMVLIFFFCCSFVFQTCTFVLLLYVRSFQAFSTCFYSLCRFSFRFEFIAPFRGGIYTFPTASISVDRCFFSLLSAKPIKLKRLEIICCSNHSLSRARSLKTTTTKKRRKTT